jgi:hypothetical protein
MIGINNMRSHFQVSKPQIQISTNISFSANQISTNISFSANRRKLAPMIINETTVVKPVLSGHH